MRKRANKFTAVMVFTIVISMEASMDNTVVLMEDGSVWA